MHVNLTLLLYALIYRPFRQILSLQRLLLPLREAFSDVREYEVLETEYAPDGSRIYRPRIIDIDILLYGDRTVDTPTLKIPQPQNGERDYAKRLLRQIL